MRVTVIGAGKMGLPLACQFALHGAVVTACDVNQSLVDTINSCKCPFDEPGLADALARIVPDGALTASTETRAAVAHSEVVVVIVPVLLTGEKEAATSTIEAVSHEIAQGLKAGTLLSYETTLPVGGTRALLPILERYGLKAGVNFDIIFSPERVKSQHVLERLSQTPKVVGGITPEAAARGAAFYQRFLGAPVINVGSLEAAELVKLAGMVYRDVNIALSNEIARYADAIGVDILPVIEAANTDSEAALLVPGIGVGGHCTPVYPYFLTRDAERRGLPAKLAERGRRINDQQPSYSLDMLEKVWVPLKLRTVLILGLGFRPQVKEALFSPAFQLWDELLRREARVFLHDPLYTEEEIRSYGFASGSLTGEEVAEVLVLNTAHEMYKKPDFRSLASRGVKAVLDGRNIWSPAELEAQGIVYVGVGRGAPGRIGGNH